MLIGCCDKNKEANGSMMKTFITLRNWCKARRPIFTFSLWCERSRDNVGMRLDDQYSPSVYGVKGAEIMLA